MPITIQVKEKGKVVKSATANGQHTTRPKDPYLVLFEQTKD